VNHDSATPLPPVWRDRLDGILREDPRLHGKLVRLIMEHLQRRKLVDIEELEREARLVHDVEGDSDPDPNRPTPRSGPREMETLNRLVLDQAERLLSPGEVEAVLQSAHRNELVIELGNTADNAAIPFEAVLNRLALVRSFLPAGGTAETPDLLGARVALIRRLISEHLEYLNIAKRYLTAGAIADVAQRIVVPGGGSGRVGGKAAGMLLAWHILADAHRRGQLEHLPRLPRTWYVRSDGVMHLIEHNNLQEYTNVKYREPADIQAAFPIIERVFKEAVFPEPFLQGLRAVLADFGERPLIVRSSSLLEDRPGSAFSGKYKSLFLANRGDLDVRLAELTNAIAEVYASVFGPDPMIYRRERGLLDFPEEMGVMIQEVVGEPVGPYYFPIYAGVAFSRNEYRWSPRLRRQDGMVRLVMGLGSRAVDRTYDDYAHLLCPAQPGIKASTRPEEVCYYSQRYIDLIDFEHGRFETRPVREVLAAHLGEIPRLEDLVSIIEEGDVRAPVGTLLDVRAADLCITFDNLIRRKGFPARMRRILEVLSEAFGFPVDLEFAADGQDLYLLQCRAQSQAVEGPTMPMPAGIPPERVIFTAGRFVSDGACLGLTHVVYVDPLDYETIPDYETMVAVGQAVGMLNRRLPRHRFILMGPGRWGSRGDIRLGVRVTYADINNAAMLIEIARQKGGYIPEVSFGTHFFQDLVEANIRYLPLYPDEPGVVFNESFLRDSPNQFAALVPEHADLAGILRVIDVPAASGGLRLNVVMDGDADRAMAYLAEA
jgi:pyruvate,water dikinase